MGSANDIQIVFCTVPDTDSGHRIAAQLVEYGHAACVNLEHTYRWELEMPAAFDDEIAREAASTYAVFTDIVLSGARNPASEWREYASSTGIPMPDFDS